MNRRHACLGLASWMGLGTLAPVHAHGLLGSVTPPLALPSVVVTLDDGRRVPLASVLQGRLTALQLMFTGCSALCPVQGAVFAELQSLVLRGTALAGTVRPQALQLLSVSIDVLGDDARTLAAWRARFGAGPQWRAAVPDPAGIDPLLDRLRGRTGGPDRHTTQVFVLDGRGRLVYRCAELAAAESVAQVLRQRPLVA